MQVQQVARLIAVVCLRGLLLLPVVVLVLVAAIFHERMNDRHERVAMERSGDPSWEFVKRLGAKAWLVENGPAFDPQVSGPRARSWG